MFQAFDDAPAAVAPARYWSELNRRNLEQLRTHGYENFKRTIALNYFTWAHAGEDDQIRFLRRHLPPVARLRAELRARLAAHHRIFTRRQSRAYNLLTHLLWEYVALDDREGILGCLAEPPEGNPPRLRIAGRPISQDLANSVLEWRSIIRAGATAPRAILELGAGYGRTAWVFLTLYPGVRYIVVDIPPALWVAQRYLSGRFPDRRVFAFRPFQNYAEVRAEFERADIALLLPTQIDLLPAQSVDLFINISSLHEMRPEQIDHYLGCVDRLVRGRFYLKAWKVSRVPYDDMVIRETDYPFRPTWSRVFQRACAVQASFFEALFAI